MYSTMHGSCTKPFRCLYRFNFYNSGSFFMGFAYFALQEM